MREGLACNANKLNVKHPLEDRLKGWEEQQERMRMEGLRRVFGIAEPVRRGMEMRICGGVGLARVCLRGMVEDERYDMG